MFPSQIDFGYAGWASYEEKLNNTVKDNPGETTLLKLKPKKGSLAFEVQIII